MTKIGDVYICKICGNIVQVLDAGAGELVCCGQKMEHIVPNTVDAAKEKHIPVIEKVAGGYKVKVGSVAHPMADDHYIPWVSLITDDGMTAHKTLKPGDAPEITVLSNAKAVKAYAYCNKHGLWVSQ